MALGALLHVYNRSVGGMRPTQQTEKKQPKTFPNTPATWRWCGDSHTTTDKKNSLSKKKKLSTKSDDVGHEIVAALHITFG